MRKREVYLSNDKAERKASGSYYTPDPIVEYIVANTVGPVLDEKLEALRPEFRKVRKTFDNEVQKSTAYPPQGVNRNDKDGIRRWAVDADLRHAQGSGGATLRPAGARPGDGQRPFPGRGRRFHHRPLAQVPQRRSRSTR